ncbi:2OG-Fe(II) oxygenase (plasmid) [Pseudomonas amygdali pv. lachrymans]|uniref:SanC n=3 Tax=Pseudomonas syringae group TaxID=136849 RepID=A0AB37RDC2_PSEAV|nr:MULTISPECIES: 2OG-Fe(II) oxygenase [Pseudomonas syringae group]KOP51845.1 SanC [Pseudomonas coronafaciens pv. porri]KPW55418.1 putative SanC [Pseudomonas syringae pv. berberidis]KPY27038.1 putative SanC [Pseudomonas syringae pv. philadelphi]AXH60472.1 2OG-Fe(II) oxygenase [Pseudomonas amygdali pv. lachrymans str. M301315]KKY53297.1 SanC [Pseudomonas amygdali pv. lachrymans]
MSGYLALKRIAHGTLHDVPFRWGQLCNIWCDDTIANKLADDFPTEGFSYRERNGGHFYRRTIIPLASHHVREPATLSAAWVDMSNELVSDSFRAAMTEFCGVDLTDYPMEAVAFRSGRDAHYLPHVDASLPRGFRLIVYFNAHWEADWGGLFRILDPCDHCKAHHTVFPLVGNASMIVRDGHYDDTWHEVTRLSGKEVVTRNTLNITYYEPGTTSTVQ